MNFLNILVKTVSFCLEQFHGCERCTQLVFTFVVLISSINYLLTYNKMTVVVTVEIWTNADCLKPWFHVKIKLF